MGACKALLEYSDGETFLTHLSRLFQEAECEVLAVVGAEGASIAAAHPGLSFVQHADWREGQLSSARAGLARALSGGAVAMLVHPVDAPTIRAATVRSLLAQSSERAALFPTYRGTPGHPLVLTRRSAERVLELKSARTLEEAVGSIAPTAIACDDAGVSLNLNTPDQYRSVFGRPPQVVSGLPNPSPTSSR
jgi:molybdenum cofactor cytidylyltransferase